MRPHNNIVHMEDRLLTAYVVEEMVGRHWLVDPVVLRHVYVGGMEVDAVILAKTKANGLRRSVGVELKKEDWPRALEQALERRGLFHYMYVVIGKGIEWGLIAAYKRGLLQKAVENGVGIIYAPRTCGRPMTIMPARYNKNGIAYADVKELLVQQPTKK